MKSSNSRRCLNLQILGHSAQATFLRPTEGTMKHWPVVHGSDCGNAMACAADLTLRHSNCRSEAQRSREKTALSKLRSRVLGKRIKVPTPNPIRMFEGMSPECRPWVATLSFLGRAFDLWDRFRTSLSAAWKPCWNEYLRKVWQRCGESNLSRFAGVSIAGARRRNPERSEGPWTYPLLVVELVALPGIEVVTH